MKETKNEQRRKYNRLPSCSSGVILLMSTTALVSCFIAGPRLTGPRIRRIGLTVLPSLSLNLSARLPRQEKKKCVISVQILDIRFVPL